jgi:transposase
MTPVCIGIKGYREVRRQSNEQEEIWLELEEEVQQCRECGSDRIVSKGRYERQARHLDVFGRASRLRIQTRRWECRECGCSFVPELPGLRPWRRSTEPWRESIYRDHHEGICASAMARMRRLGSATVGRIYAEFTGRKARERESLQCPQILGIDEHRVHRGMPFATTFCDLRNRRIFDIVPGRSESELAAFLGRLQGREKVKVVCIDLSSSYRALVRRWFPNARIVADRFHVVRVLQHHFLDMARQIVPELKNHRGRLGVLRRHPSRLEERHQARLKKLLGDHPALQPFYEKMIELWDLLRLKHQTAKACRHHISHLLRLIDELRHSAFEPLVRLAKTLHGWREALVTMWRFTKNNAITEGFHRKMKLIQRRAFGFRNFHNYRLRVIAHCG